MSNNKATQGLAYMVGRSATEKIWDIRGGLIQTAQDLGIEIEELSYEDTNKIRLSVSQKYCGREKTDHLWRSTGYPNISAHRNFEGDGYRLIGSFVKQDRAIIFFNKEDERAGFIFQSGSDLIKLLDEWLFYDLYVTDNELSYLICFNTYNYLAALGPAADWLRSLQDENGELIRPISEIISC